MFRRVRNGAYLPIALLLAALAGCGGVGGGGDDGPAGAGALTTMGFSLSDEIAESRVGIFRKAHPEVRLTISEGGFDEQQFLSAVASDNPPDLIYFDRKLIGTYATRGSIQPLDGCVAEANIDLNQYRPAARQQVTLGGTVYGIPEFYISRVMYVNEAALADAGLTADDLDVSDWAGSVALNKRLARLSGDRLTRIGIDPKIPEMLPLWAKANGVDMLSADGRTANLNDPRLVEAVEHGVRLINDQGGWGRFKSFRDTFDFFGAQSPLAKNQIVAWPMEDWFLSQVARNTPRAELVVKPFTDRQGRPLTQASGLAWAIPKGARNAAAACEFVKTMTATPTWVAAAKARAQARKAENLPFTGLYTANADADKEIFDTVYRPSGNPRFDNAVQTLLAVQATAFATPASPAGAEFDKAWTDAINRVLAGQATPAESLARGQREAQAALDRAGG